MAPISAVLMCREIVEVGVPRSSSALAIAGLRWLQGLRCRWNGRQHGPPRRTRVEHEVGGPIGGVENELTRGNPDPCRCIRPQATQRYWPSIGQSFDHLPLNLATPV